MADSQLKISCYTNAEYADETYWFLRNKKGDIISKKLFNEKKFQHTMTVIAQMFPYLEIEFIEELN